MPTTYAHYRFGCDAVRRLPVSVQNEIAQHRQLFDFGVHGPDLLFYYKPLGTNPVSRLGYACHGRTGRDFFSQAISAASSQPSRVYLYGVLCHFALDRECHPYVGEKEKSGVSHSAIEASFDRFLMAQDGLDPVRHCVTGHLLPHMATAETIAPFYPPLTPAQIYKAQKSMVFYLNLLTASGGKRAILSGALRLAGQSSIRDMLVPLSQNPACAHSDKILFSHYGDALALYETLLSQLLQCLGGQGHLGAGYDHTFGET